MSDRNIIISLIALQLLLCLLVIPLFPISLDEPFSIYHAQLPVDELLTEVNKGNNSPLHFLLLHFWIKLFGAGVYAVRILSVLFSLVSIVFLYKLGRKFWKKEYAALLVGLFIFSRLNHYVAMEARMYGLFTLFFILILYDLYRLMFEDKRVFISLGIWNALLLYTHYLGGVVILMECLVFLVFYKELSRSKLIQATLTIGVGGLLFIPGLSVFFNRASDFSTAGSWVPDAVLFDLWANLVKLFGNQFVIITTLALIVFLYFLRRDKEMEFPRVPIRFFGLWFVGLYFLMFLISVLVQPIFFIKYLQFLTVPLFFVLVAFWQRIDFGKKYNYLVVLLLVPFAVSFKPVPNINRNTDQLVEFVQANKTDQTTVYYCPPHYSLTLAYHYDREIFEDYNHTAQRMETSGFVPVYSGDDVDLNLEKIIYIDFDSKLLYPGNSILETLDANYLFEKSEAYKGDFNVYCYQKNNSFITFV